jgi:hypothetical protein
MTDQERIASLKSYIKYKEASLQRTLDQYGSGVRPSWVSEEMATASSGLSRAYKELTKLGGEI